MPAAVAFIDVLGVADAVLVDERDLELVDDAVADAELVAVRVEVAELVAVLVAAAAVPVAVDEAVEVAVADFEVRRTVELVAVAVALAVAEAVNVGVGSALYVTLAVRFAGQAAPAAQKMRTQVGGPPAPGTPEMVTFCVLFGAVTD